jgi:hypothetical protein
LAGDDQQNEDSVFHYEDGVPVFDTNARLHNVEREQAAAKKRDEEYKGEQLKINRRMMWFTGILVVCTAATGGISIWQATIASRSARAAQSAAHTAKDTLGEIQRSESDTHTLAQATKSAADTARDTLVNSQHAFEMDERPYIVQEPGHPEFALHGFVPNQRLSINVKFKNVGKLPAIRVINSVHFVQRIHPSGKPFSKEVVTSNREFTEKWFAQLRADSAKSRREIMLYSKGHGQDVAPGDGGFFSPNDNVVLSDTEYRRVADDSAPSESLFLFWVSTYTDTFGTLYETDTCWFYNGPRPEIWHRCDAFNEIR